MKKNKRKKTNIRRIWLSAGVIGMLAIAILLGTQLPATGNEEGAWLDKVVFTVEAGICGDVNCDGVVNMADVMLLWYDIADYPAPGVWTVMCCGD